MPISKSKVAAKAHENHCKDCEKDIQTLKKSLAGLEKQNADLKKELSALKKSLSELLKVKPAEKDERLDVVISVLRSDPKYRRALKGKV